MTTHEQLLKLLAKNSAQSPMTFADLLAISGLQPATLTMVLDQMYVARSINQATVTRIGIKQREVWPTGMANQLNAYADPSKRVAPTPLPPLPRRDEIKPKLMEELDMTQDLEVAEKQPRALQVLKYIEANPGTSTAEINQEFSFISPVSYIRNHIDNKKVVAVYMTKRAAKYTIADGFTAASIYGNGVKNSGRHPDTVPCHVGNELPTLPLLELADAEPAPIYDIPAFLRKSQEQQPFEPAALKTTINPPSQDDFAIDAINTLFDLLPPESALVIGRADGALQIDIEALVFGTPVTKTVQLNEVISILSALHIVTVEMA